MPKNQKTTLDLYFTPYKAQTKEMSATEKAMLNLPQAISEATSDSETAYKPHRKRPIGTLAGILTFIRVILHPDITQQFTLETINRQLCIANPTVRLKLTKELSNLNPKAWQFNH